MNLIADVQTAISAFRAMVANPSFLTVVALVAAAGKVVSDITSVLTPSQVQAAHDQAKQLKGQSTASLLSGLESTVGSAKTSGSIPWQTILAYILALIQQLLTPVTPA